MNRRVLLFLAVCTVGLLVLAAPVFGSDQPTVIYPEQEERVVAPGETVDLQVMVSSDGGYDDIGLEYIKLEASHNSEYMSATGVEVASYLEGGEPTDVFEEADIDNDEGIVVAEQWRDPARGGVIGDELFATITFEIDEDAPEKNVTVSFEDSAVDLVDEYPMFVYDHDATLVIDEDASVDDQSETDGEDNLVSDGNSDGNESVDDEVGSSLDTDASGTVFLVGLIGVFVVAGALTVVLRRNFADET